MFDWDGTAVTDRRQDARPLADLIEPLLAGRVWAVIVTGTNFGNIDRQFCRLVAPGPRRRLLVCTNRGSEVYGFDRRGATVRRWLRTATAEEDRALTAVAEAVRDRLAAETGLDIRIVYDRLNRRKIDLIPLPEWSDPPKARIGELLQAVQTRLRGAGWSGGLSAAIRLAGRLARERGLPDARITSDVKHIEIGLTDKGDSLDWVKREVLRPGGIAMADVLIAGDEFGDVAGFAGSDDRLRAGAEDAVVVSVGAEPNGVPEGVRHLGGGPARFQELLAEQVHLRRPRHSMRDDDWAGTALSPSPDPAWRLEEHNYNPALEHEVESRFAIANGLLGVRGSMEQPTDASRPRTYVAGVFDAPGDPPALPALAPAPDWLRLRLTIDGEPLSIERGEALDHSRTLDLARGAMLGAWRHRTEAGHAVRLDTLRLVSLADRRLATQVARIDVERPASLELEAWMAPAERGLAPGGTGLEPGVWQTRDGKHHVALGSHAMLRVGGAILPPQVSGEGHWRWTWTATPGRTAQLSRTIAVARESAEDASTAASAALRRALRMGTRRLLAAHSDAWRKRWAASGVEIDGDDAAQRALRFAVYHLNGAANPDDERVSIAARGLTGDGYLGHVFWDTEIFLLPFYTFTWPRAARALLMYRFHTLPAARAKAARLGYRGALYAWESAGSGEEATPTLAVGPDGRVIPIRSGTDEHHISADVAYAVWHYWQATADSAFLLDAGAEILLETARFWASRAQPEPDGRYHIRRVIGPDEYHGLVDDNAYTNEMARWNLECGLEAAALLRARWPRRWAALAGRLSLKDAELAAWREVAESLVTGFDRERGLFEQFAGFFDLEPVDLAAYADRAAPMDVVLGPERVGRAQVIKQADVVMLLALLWDRFPAEVRRANFRYYEPRCGHGSSLSPAAHALVAARLGDVELADRYLHQAAAIDLDDTMGNAAAGVHMGALGGLWQAVVLGMAGLGLRPDGLRLDPHLPSGWRAVRFPVRWRGRQVRVAMERGSPSLTVSLESGAPLVVEVGGVTRKLARGESCTWRQRGPDGRWKEVAA